MNVHDEEVHALIARQAADWFLAQRDGILGARERQAFDEWLLASPVHVAEYLGVTAIALALPTAADDPDSPLDAILERARHESGHVVAPIDSHSSSRRHKASVLRSWNLVAAASLMVAFGVAVLLWRSHSPEKAAPMAASAPMTIRSGHGEQVTRRLSDASLLSLNTDTEVEVRLNAHERLTVLRRGEVSVQVAHEPRPFKVRAGVAEITAHGTSFDVRLDQDTTIVTVVEGHVAVAPSPAGGRQIGGGAATVQVLQTPVVQLGPNEQLRVSQTTWPVAPSAVDAQRVIAWLQRRIVFENEPLANVAMEFNRYVSVPIEIDGPELRRLRISGVFADDDTEAFVAFLRSMKGLRVDVTPARIRVLEARARAAPQHSPESR